MENFKGVLKKRIWILKLITFVSVLCIATISQWSRYLKFNSSGELDFIVGFQFGLFIAIELILVKVIYNYSKAIKDTEQLRILYIKENDERRAFISTQIGHFGFHIVFLGLVFAAVIAGYFDKTIFVTLLSVVVFIAIVKGGLKLYLWRKY